MEITSEVTNIVHNLELLLDIGMHGLTKHLGQPQAAPH